MLILAVRSLANTLRAVARSADLCRAQPRQHAAGHGQGRECLARGLRFAVPCRESEVLIFAAHSFANTLRAMARVESVLHEVFDSPCHAESALVLIFAVRSFANTLRAMA